MTEAERLASLNAEVVICVRETTNAITGGNYTFAVNDVKLLGHLAKRAIAAGLIDGFDRPTTRNLERKRDESIAENKTNS